MNSLNDTFLDQIENQGYAVIDSFFPANKALEIALKLDELRGKRIFKKAGIGKEDDYQIDQSQRGYYILWMDTENGEGPLVELIA